jgi:hypothetical protein
MLAQAMQTADPGSADDQLTASLLRLLRWLQSEGYRFTTVTPATLVLYTGVAIADGTDPLLAALAPQLAVALPRDGSGRVRRGAGGSRLPRRGPHRCRHAGRAAIRIVLWLCTGRLPERRKRALRAPVRSEAAHPTRTVRASVRSEAAHPTRTGGWL